MPKLQRFTPPDMTGTGGISTKCENCSMVNCTSSFCSQKTTSALAQKPAAPVSSAKKSKAAKPRATIAKSNQACNAIMDQQPNKVGRDVFLEEAGPVLGPALLKLLRDPSRPPFNNSFREDGQWMVPPGGVANFPICEPNADETTLKRTFEMNDLYRLQFDGEWKLKIGKKLKRFIPLNSYGHSGLSRAHILAGLSNFTTYTVDNGKNTDCDTEDFHLIVLHERANLFANEWEEDGAFSKCYF